MRTAGSMRCKFTIKFSILQIKKAIRKRRGTVLYAH